MYGGHHWQCRGGMTKSFGPSVALRKQLSSAPPTCLMLENARESQSHSKQAPLASFFAWLVTLITHHRMQRTIKATLTPLLWGQPSAEKAVLRRILIWLWCARWLSGHKAKLVHRETSDEFLTAAVFLMMVQKDDTLLQCSANFWRITKLRHSQWFHLAFGKKRERGMKWASACTKSCKITVAFVVWY